MLFDGVDLKGLYYVDLIDMYTKTGWEGLNLQIHYCLPRHTLDNGIKMLHGDDGIRELHRTFKARVVPMYFDEKQGPLLDVDSQRNILPSEETIHSPLLISLKMTQYFLCPGFLSLHKFLNPRSTLLLKVDRGASPSVLERMFICLSGLRGGFLDGCSLIIGPDACFLKGVYKEQLLVAVGRDDNDNIYSIAMGYAIASISYHRLNIEDFVDDYCKKDACMKVYKHMINLVPEMHDFEKSRLGIVDPPQVKRWGGPKRLEGMKMM